LLDRVDRVIDGDTLLVRIDLGLRSWTVEPLRRRGIDAGHLDCRAGQRACTCETAPSLPQSTMAGMSVLSTPDRR